MLRSKQIQDYVEAKLEDFKPGVPLPADVHLYFNSNSHILIWRKRGEKLTEKFIRKYRNRGMQQIWIHRDDHALWLKYLEDEAEPEAQEGAVEAPAALAEAIAPAPAAAVPRTEEGRDIVKTLQNEVLPDRHKTALVARAARELLHETARPTDPILQLEAMGHARDAVRDILDSVLEGAVPDVRNLINEIWDIGTLDPGLNHGINVACFSVLFAMSFGRIGQELLSDIALAALLHDIGLTQVPAQVVQMPWTEHSGRPLQQFQRHVDEGLRLLDEFAPGVSPRVRPLIQQHHEKFDGMGYPLQLQGFQFNDIAQLISMADSLVSMASGQWDGQPRMLLETLTQFEALEDPSANGEYFNPDVFKAVVRWMRNPGSLSSKLKASDIVRSTTRDLMKRGAGR